MERPRYSPRLVRVVDGLLLTALLAAALAWPVSSPPISTHGEAREGLVIQDIVENGRWVLPHRNGELPSKPPLFHWIAAGIASVAGVSDVTVRLPSALAAWVMALATFALGVHLGGRLVGWLAVGALAGTHGFWTAASEARVDMVFAAAVTVALVAFFFWHRARGRWARAACYVAVGAAVLAKGPAGAVLPGVIIVAFVLREHARRGGGGALAVWSDVRALWSWPLALLVVTVDLGWYALAYRAGGDEFLAVQLMHENVQRFAGRGVFGMHGGRPVLAMALELVTDLAPWNLVLPWAAFQWTRGRREDEGGRFLHAWWLAILAVFTLAYGKRSIYLLPLYPAIALLAGRALAAALVKVPAEASHLWGRVPIPARARRAFPAHPATALVALAIVVFDVVLLGVGQVAREFSDRRKSLVSFAREVDRQLPADARLHAGTGLSDSDLQVLAYRLARAIPRGAALVPVADTPRVYCLLPAPAADALAEPGAERLVVSERRGAQVALVGGLREGDCAAITR